MKKSDKEKIPHLIAFLSGMVLFATPIMKWISEYAQRCPECAPDPVRIVLYTIACVTGAIVMYWSNKEISRIEKQERDEPELK